jgi:hypothetical protein
MRPKQPETTISGDLFRARLDQVINLSANWHSSQARSIGTLSTARSLRFTAIRGGP